MWNLVRDIVCGAVETILILAILVALFELCFPTKAIWDDLADEEDAE